MALCGWCANSLDASRNASYCSHACYLAWMRDRAADGILARFWGKVNIPSDDGCWLWTGSTIKGYGQFTVSEDGARRMVYAHRFAWQCLNGAIPETLSVLHHCDTPRCCNPNHLFLGTQAANLADARTKGRLDESKARTRVLTPEERLRIFEMPAFRGICTSLARQFGVTKVCISLIRSGRFTRPTPQPVLERVPPVLVPVRGELQLQPVETVSETRDDRNQLGKQLSRPEGV